MNAAEQHYVCELDDFLPLFDSKNDLTTLIRTYHVSTDSQGPRLGTFFMLKSTEHEISTAHEN